MYASIGTWTSNSPRPSSADGSVKDSLINAKGTAAGYNYAIG